MTMEVMMVVNYHHKLRLRHMRNVKLEPCYPSIRKFLTLADCAVQV